MAGIRCTYGEPGKAFAHLVGMVVDVGLNPRVEECQASARGQQKRKLFIRLLNWRFPFHNVKGGRRFHSFLPQPRMEHLGAGMGLIGTWPLQSFVLTNAAIGHAAKIGGQLAHLIEHTFGIQSRPLRTQGFRQLGNNPDIILGLTRAPAGRLHQLHPTFTIGIGPRAFGK